MTAFKTVAVFGANGSIGNVLLHALVNCKEQSFNVIAFTSPSSSLEATGDLTNITIQRVDLSTATAEELTPLLKRVDVVVSALGGTIIEKQHVIQDAAAQAGVRRFYPSEFGMHQIPILPGKGPYIHPVWATKMKCMERAMKHPAIKSGKMTYTVIGCAEMYDVPAESILCPWVDVDAPEYTVQAMDDTNAKMDYSSVHDVAAFEVASICHPELSENKILGFRSDHISYSEIAALLKKHSNKPVHLNVTPIETLEAILDNPSLTPKELQTGSTFPVDFWLLLRYVQGQGYFWRAPGQLHNELFPHVKTTTFDEYFAGLFK